MRTHIHRYLSATPRKEEGSRVVVGGSRSGQGGNAAEAQTQRREGLTHASGADYTLIEP